MGHSRGGYVHRSVPVSRLKGFSVVFKDDLYELACFDLKRNLATDTPTQRGRTTVNGLVGIYENILGNSLQHVRKQLTDGGIPLGASIEPDEDGPKSVL